jgi:hypothetical protein
MTAWFDRLLWVAAGLAFVGVAVLATESLPSAAAARLLALPEGWTFPAGCLSW